MPLSDSKLPRLMTALPGPRAKQLIERDHSVVSLSYTRDYPLVAKSGRGALVSAACRAHVFDGRGRALVSWVSSSDRADNVY